jgi:hypothetical protein
LRRSTRINLPELDASFVALVSDFHSCEVPTGVTDRTAQPAVLEHIRDAQALNSDVPDPVD